MGHATLIISHSIMPDVLRIGLGLPQGFEIVDLIGEEPSRWAWRVVVSHPDLPDVEEGMMLPVLRTVYEMIPLSGPDGDSGRAVTLAVYGENGGEWTSETRIIRSETTT